MEMERKPHMSITEQSDDYWVGLTYLMDKHKPVTLAEALHLVSVVENYIAHHSTGNLRDQLIKE